MAFTAVSTSLTVSAAERAVIWAMSSERGCKPEPPKILSPQLQPRTGGRTNSHVTTAAISQSENAGDKVSGHPAYPTRFPVQLLPCRDHRLLSLSEGDCTEYQESAAPPELAACKAA
jgi:hypothetical protein